MGRKIYILGLAVLLGFGSLTAQDRVQNTPLAIDFYGDSIQIPHHNALLVSLQQPLSTKAIERFSADLKAVDIEPLLNNLMAYKKEKKLDDWLYYQLIRTAAEAISPKKDNYHRYTLYKWFLLNQSGYSSFARLRNDTLLLYIQSEQLVYDIPYLMDNGKQYVCLNYHDYWLVDFKEGSFETVAASNQLNPQSFSYKISSLPNFKPENYEMKQLHFEYKQSNYEFKVMVNKEVKKIFGNYPTVEYAVQFSVPLSNTTYQSLIPVLKKTVASMSQKNGIDYLMHLTRSSFAFENDAALYGKDKRFSPEQTLLYDYSDCEDRAAFFFYLVKEIYNLPMIVLSYPAHITVAVQFDKPLSKPLVYKGNNYWVCEPTPQSKDLKIGQGVAALRKQAYEVVYEYQPSLR